MHARQNFETIDSTNEYLKRNSALLPDGFVVSADEQTFGKGRLARRWESRRGEGAWFSILLKDRQLNGENAVGLVFVCALAGARALRQLTKNADILVKWPNDLVLNGKKIAGILCESGFAGDRLAYCICGIGINLNATAFPQELPWASSIRIETGLTLDAEDVIKAFLIEFDMHAETLLRSGLKPILEALKPVSATLGRRVCAVGGAADLTGTAVDFGADGTLIVDDGHCRHNISVGDVSIRGVMGYT